jgi:hypothetical protein
VLDVVSTGWGWLATHRIEHAGGVVIGRSRAGFPFETASFWMYDAESPAERATVRRSLGERVFRRAHGAVATGGSRAARWSPRTAELPGGVTLTEPSAVRAGGFAGNAAIAAAAAWALQFGACLARCGARRRRRLCPRCAYPAVGAGDAEASACPECGAGG